jgi:outer membrane protein assembly factor BamB
MRSKLALLVCIVSLIPCGVRAQGRPTIRLSKQVGPPTTRLKISGNGFTPNVGVSISFDSIHMSRTQTDASGAFSGAPLMVPQKAMPGDHTVSALDDNGVIAFAPFLVQTDWPQFHFSPVHAGFNPYEFILSPATVGAINAAWTALGFGHEMSPPVVAGGSVYVGDWFFGSTLYALDAKSGSSLWTFAADNDIEFAPAVSGSTVFFSDCAWSAHTFGPAKVYAVTASSGNLLWKFPTYGDFSSAPTVVNGVVYAVSDGNPGAVYALKAATGALLWSFPINTDLNPPSPAVANGIVYAAGDTAYALNASTGAMLWSQPLPGLALTSTALAKGAVYLHLDNDEDVALSQVNGTLLWTFDPMSGFYSESSPAVGKGLVYVSCRLSLCALDAKTGVLAWSFPTSATVRSSPAVANGVVYFGNDQGDLYALDAGSGAYLWNYNVGGFLHSPAVVDGSMYVNGGYVNGGGGLVWAFR